ncbi:MAG: efflux transporter outer membrane subunit, partial [Acetobacteraceae bacterium]
MMGGSTAILTGCDVGPRYERPQADIPAAFRATPESAAAAWPAPGWWRGFRSPDLDELIAMARARNFDLAVAAARVRQADAQVRIAGAALFPSLAGSGSANWQRVGINTGSSRTRLGGGATYDLHSYGIGLDAAYIVDFWGQNRATKQAAVATAVATRFDQQTVALTVDTTVASAWFTALALADRLSVAKENLSAFEMTLAAIKGRMAAGTANALDVAQEETLVAQVRAVIPNLQGQIEQQVIGLGILTGRPPEAITVRPGTLTALSLPLVSPGLPSEVLLRRPDIAAAEARLVAANFDIKAARAAFFPTIRLTGSAGFQAAALNALLTPGGTLMSAVAGFTAPLFDGGLLRGQLEYSKAVYEELIAQ